ncbi:MAG TPA: GDSL-type esterase/lipase family protein [Alphaproteobacteria bacterium]|jgi:acyl-CoA thioesterase-1|nr:GDSL-type esterase/lipase family protein [Alphaproteobacteria bacterium]
MTLRTYGCGAARRLLFIACLLFIALCLGALAGVAHADPIRIVAIGDSNFDPPGVDPDLTYPPKLQAALRAKGHDVTVVNAGHRGDQTKDVLHRLDRDVPAGTDIALIGVGVNDKAERVSSETIGRNLDDIVHRLRERRIEVLLFGLGNPSDPNCCSGAGIAQRNGALFYRQFQDGVIDDAALHVERQRPAPGSSLINGSKSATAWHLNPAGYDIVVQRTLPLVEELVAKARAKRE